MNTIHTHGFLLPVGTIENMSEKSQRGKYLNKRFTLDGERDRIIVLMRLKQLTATGKK